MIGHALYSAQCLSLLTWLAKVGPSEHLSLLWQEGSSSTTSSVWEQSVFASHCRADAKIA